MRMILCLAGLWSGPALAANAEAIWWNGPVLTMEDGQPRAGAVAVTDGRIVAVGPADAVMAAERGPATVMHDLGGRALLPGFVDAHGHFSAVGVQALSANLLPPPDGPARDIAGVQAIMRDFIRTSPMVAEYGVAIGFDYDDSQLVERRAPTRQELDAVSTDIPIMLIHQSGHLGAYNSKALAKLGLGPDSPDPAGGVIQREADGRTPNGVLEEAAHNRALFALLPKFTPAQGMALLAAAERIYAANGFTTVQEGRADPGTLALLAGAARAGLLGLDVVAYADIVSNADNAMLDGPLMGRSYQRRFRIGGVKLSLDGSPQGKTAWFTRPYLVPPHGQGAGYAGYPAFAGKGEAAGWMARAHAKNWQLLVHANGDAAIDQMIEGVAAARAAHGGGDRRTVLIHGQYLRADQIPALKALGIFPALFPMHTFYWGDWHASSVAGPERAAFISPAAAVRAAGMKFSIHHDAPVTFPNSVRVLETAVNRRTRSGRVLGPEQRVSVEVALKAMTIWPAWQHFEEGEKGSIAAGKRADFVVLDRDPTMVPPEALAGLRVMATVKDGVEIYRAK